MDPNAALENIRSLVASIIESIDEQDEHDDENCSVDVGDVSMLCDTFNGLDNWLKSGGFKPGEWTHE